MIVFKKIGEHWYIANSWKLQWTSWKCSFDQSSFFIIYLLKRRSCCACTKHCRIFAEMLILLWLIKQVVKGNITISSVMQILQEYAMAAENSHIILRWFGSGIYRRSSILLYWCHLTWILFALSGSVAWTVWIYFMIWALVTVVYLIEVGGSVSNF